jgi:hypothetical protein
MEYRKGKTVKLLNVNTMGRECILKPFHPWLQAAEVSLLPLSGRAPLLLKNRIKQIDESTVRLDL